VNGEVGRSAQLSQTGAIYTNNCVNECNGDISPTISQALLLIKDRMSSCSSLMKPNLPADCGAHPDGGSQPTSVWISAGIDVG